MNSLLLIVGIVTALAGVQAAIWIPLGVRAKRRSDAFWVDFDAQVAASGEAVILAREPCVCRGGTGAFSVLKGNGSVALTSTRLVVRKGTGGVIEVPTSRVTGAHKAKIFLGSVVATKEHVVVEVTGPAEVGFFVNDPDRWVAALRQRPNTSPPDAFTNPRNISPTPTNTHRAEPG